MANQKGIIKLKGTIGDLTFYKSKDGYMAREKGGIDAKRWATDPAFKRTRENAQEFGHSGKMGSLLNRVFRPITMGLSDKRLTSRLVKKVLGIVKTDIVNARGSRLFVEGDIKQMKEFDFNVKTNFKSVVSADHQVIWDRATGEWKVTFTGFTPQERIGVPAGTSHFRLLAAAASIDFGEGVYELKLNKSAIMAWDEVEIPALELTDSLEPASVHPVFVVVGIEFYQEVNGSHYLLSNGAFNAAKIVTVDVI